MAPTLFFILALFLEHTSAAESKAEAESINRSNNHNYGYALYGFWGAVLVFGILRRFCQRVDSLQTTQRITDSEEQITPTTERQWTTLSYWSRRYLTTPPAFGTRHAQLSYWCSIPTRMEFVVIVGYWILTLVLCGVGYEYYPGTSSALDTQRWKTFANRCGVLALSNLPILWVFAGRNNIFLWATGWSFQTFSMFHRHIARVVILLTIGHSAAFTHTAVTTNLPSGGTVWQSALTQDWYIWGIVGTTATGVFWLTAVSWLRRKSYELFLVMHISLGILVIYAIFRHLAKVGGAFDHYLWSVVVIWSFDRLLRLVRLVACNLHVTYGKKFLRTTSTVAVYDEKSDVIKLQIETPGLGLLGPAPGQYCFVYQPFSCKFWENHPFTVGAWTAGLPSSSASSMTEVTPLPSPISEKPSRIDSLTSGLAGSLSKKDSLAPTSDKKTLVFWVRPYDGWTRKLRDQCMKTPSHTCQPHLLLEGPYGRSQNLHKFDTVVFIVGGTGISSVLPYIRDHATRSNEGTSQVTNIKLVWASRKAAFVQSIYESELSSILPRTDFKLEVFLTNDFSAVGYPSTEEVKLESSSTSSTLSVGSQHGRPNLDNIVESTVAELRTSERCAFFVCGPAAMADDARSAVHAAMRKGHRNVEYFEDSFGW